MADPGSPAYGVVVRHLALCALVLAACGRKPPPPPKTALDRINGLRGDAALTEDEILTKTALAHAEDDGASAVLRRHEVARVVLTERRERVGAGDPLASLAKRGEQVAPFLHRAVDQVRDQLGVGVRADLAATVLELAAKLAVVLDDAVVDDGDRAGPEIGVASIT